jgi:peptidoglycan/xylan/chitin deacetylase (PgdA/CDA1 family)
MPRKSSKKNGCPITLPTSFPILTFHAVDDRRSVISIRPEIFQRGMERLHQCGFRSLSLTKAADYLRRGTPFPDRSFGITFDDGYQSVYEKAFPVLSHYGMSATVFLTVGNKDMDRHAGRLPSIEDRSMLSWDEMGEMRRYGIDFGAHTLTHPDLTCLSQSQITVEVCDSKAIIEDKLGVPVSSFAYPYGRYDNQSREIVSQCFECACTDRLGLVKAGSDMFALERADAYYLRRNGLFYIMTTPLFPYYIRACNIPRSIRRAIYKDRK